MTRWAAVAGTALLLSLAPAHAAGGVQVEPVTFAVTNVNQSGVPCSSDGASYTVAGHLVAPAGPLPTSVTLYLHGLGFGEFFWSFSQVPAYDYATAMADRGLASVVVDRLGYGASGHPTGDASCLGAQATIAHQVVTALRSGRYGGGSHAFAKVVLAGHSAGGTIAEIEASSFQDVDGLIVMAYADLGATQRTNQEFSHASLACAQGGQPAGPGEPSGYAPFGQTAADFQRDMFFSASPRVIAGATALRNLDPCGDDDSFPQAIAHNLVGLSSVTVPVLLAYGADDALFQAPGTSDQHLLFSGSHDVHTVVLAGTGHALTLERSAPELRQIVAVWLGSRGFV